MTSHPPVVLALVSDAELFDNTDRLAAAVGLRTVRVQNPPRKLWRTAAAVILDDDGARRCVRAEMPRRGAVFLVGTSEPAPAMWASAVEVGAQQLCVWPDQEAELVRHLSEAADMSRVASQCGRVIAVTAGRGGGGASIFAAALAQRAGEALLVDLDPCGGGIDLLLGLESAPGLRWPEMATASGRLSWAAVREVLPRKGDVSMLSCSRSYHEIDPGAALAVFDGGRRCGVMVICDVPRPLTATALHVIENADLVVVVTSCDVRAVAATGAIAGVIRTVNSNLGLVVRGPAPSGLRAAEVVEVTAVPLLAAMRPEPMLAVQLEQGGLRVRQRSPLAVAVRKVLGVVHNGDGVRAA